MDTTHINGLISNGYIGEAIDELISLSDKFFLSFNTEIYLASSRFNALNNEKRKGTISQADYSREINSITYSLLELVKLINEIDDTKIRTKLFENELDAIYKLSSDFEETKYIASVSSKLRTKNSIVTEIAKRLIQTPQLLQIILNNPSNGLVCGLCRKIQIAPDYNDLSILESVTNNISGDFTKGNVVNAIAELIYCHKLVIDDDLRIMRILNIVRINADKPLLKNIERTEAALQYLTETM